jgi:hypothetical protein
MMLKGGSKLEVIQLQHVVFNSFNVIQPNSFKSSKFKIQAYQQVEIKCREDPEAEWAASAPNNKIPFTSCRSSPFDSVLGH